MARKSFVLTVIGSVAAVWLVTTLAVADQPEPAGQAVQTQESIRSQVQARQPNGYGAPLAAAGQEVGRQSRRQLGPGDGADNSADPPVVGSNKQSKARAKRGADSDPAAAVGRKGSKKSTTGSDRAPTASRLRQRLRDPASGCIGTPMTSRSHASGGQRRGGGRR